jgi:hypothetical protein
MSCAWVAWKPWCGHCYHHRCSVGLPSPLLLPTPTLARRLARVASGGGAGSGSGHLNGDLGHLGDDPGLSWQWLCHYSCRGSAMSSFGANNLW